MTTRLRRRPTRPRRRSRRDGNEAETTRPRREVRDRRRARAEAGRRRRGARDEARHRQDLQPRRRDKLRRLHDRARPEAAPNTSASLVALARDGFFDDVIFHRVVPGFVIQGGDPTGTGTGGPGYKTVDVPPQDAQYIQGVVAMAKSGVEPPGTSGSQFFVVTGADVGAAARVRGRRQGHRRARHRAENRCARHGRRPAVDSRRDREGHGRGELMPALAAVMLAAGAATRFGAPKQRCSCPPCSRGCEPRGVDELVVVAGAYELESEARDRPVPGLAARPGRIAALRPRRARRRRSRRRSSSSRTGPSSRPPRSPGRRSLARRAAPRSSPRATAASAATHSSSRARSGRTFPTRVCARASRCSSRATTWARRATWTTLPTSGGLPLERRVGLAARRASRSAPPASLARGDRM